MELKLDKKSYERLQNHFEELATLEHDAFLIKIEELV